jgi:hypothetical protein
MMRRPNRAGSAALAVMLAAGAAALPLPARQALGHGGDHFSAGEPGNPKKAARIVTVTMSEGDGTMA